ncbi:MAG: MmgE/PrpD family protein [Paracoccus sp. (in: a-proteobacteria)]|nr:MmgE/PrpD family protein [Paracoccus sp. (in: a-proteobacteria)]
MSGAAPDGPTRRRMDTLDHLAGFARNLRFDDLPDAVVRAAGRSVLDCTTAALAGSGGTGAAAARGAAMAAFGQDQAASLWFTGRKAPVLAAVLGNCTAASILDLDDGHRAAIGHPGAAIIPACLAIAEEQGSSWQDLITAIVLGYEIAVRVAAARDAARLDTMSTGRWASYGVAAATARLRGLDHAAMVQAMAIAGVHAPNQSAAGYSKIMGNHVKEGIPWSALTGSMAVSLAQAGLTGPTDILDHADYFDAGAVLRDLGQSFEIEGTYFKPYSCCRWAHAAIDGLHEVLTAQQIGWQAVEAVEVHTFERALRLSNEADPDTLEGAQYSVPFVLGVAATEGVGALLPLTGASLQRAPAVSFARRVALMVDPDIDRAFPARTGARIVIRTAAAEHSRIIRHPLGDPANPMSRAQLLEKLHIATRAVMTPSRQAEITAALSDFEAGDYRPLLGALAKAM